VHHLLSVHPFASLSFLHFFTSSSCRKSTKEKKEGRRGHITVQRTSHSLPLIRHLQSLRRNSCPSLKKEPVHPDAHYLIRSLAAVHALFSILNASLSTQSDSDSSQRLLGDCTIVRRFRNVLENAGESWFAGWTGYQCCQRDSHHFGCGFEILR
jgi:hypothetical protein